MKKILSLFFVIPLCVLSMFTIIYLFSKDEPLFFLKNIKINGVYQLKDSDVVSRISPFLKENLFKVDVVKMKEAITSHPFVREVNIKRVFPFSIVIDVIERKPSALWVNQEGEIHVVDENGEPYKNLSREDVKAMFIINAKERSEVKSVYREINAWIREGIVKKEILSEVAYCDGGFTIFGTDEGVEIILGKEDQKGRLKRALTVLEDAKRRGFLIKCIDARFEKGAIIKERKG